MCVSTYRVKNGIIDTDSEFGLLLLDTDQADGWYYILDGVNEDSIGPFVSEEVAKQEGRKALDVMDELLIDEG